MGLFDWFRGPRNSANAEREAHARESVERVVQLSNPRLHFARGYRARLLPAVRTAMEYARALVASMPPARDATAAAWQSDAYIRAFFATPDDLARAFSRSAEMRAWFDTHTTATDAYTVLSMLLTERRTLGAALEDGVVRRDVAQTAVTFGDYRARICASSEAELRQELERRIVDQLALSGLLKATQDQSQRDLLEQERALLKTRMKLLEGRGAGLVGLSGQNAPDDSHLSRLHSDLAINEERLKSLSAGAEALNYQLDRLSEVLSKPEEHLFITEKRLRLDRMNIVLDEASTAPGETLDLQIGRIPMPDAPPEFRTLIFVRLPKSVLLPKSALLRDAARELH